MLLTIFIFLVFLYFIAFLEDLEGRFILLLLIVFMFVSFIKVGTDHCRDLSIIKMSDDLIKIQEESIKETDIQMKDLSSSVPSNALMNQDSPYKSLIELRGERINELSIIKRKIVDSKISIYERKLGFFSFIVWYFGDK